jgi:DNA (cytosine-5)-methyltransferase 1
MRAIDLFAGAGGFSLGATYAGFHVDHAIEIDEWAAATLARNHEGTRITQVDITTLSDEWVRSEIPRYPELLIGGPPCQGFSHAGPSRKDPKDPRNSLFEEFIRFVGLLEPAVAIVENVPGILRAKTANGERVANVIESEFRRLGYQVTRLTLDADLYGVPQIRRRVFFIASLSGSELSVPPPTHTEAEDLFTSGLPPVLTLREAIGDLPLVDVGFNEVSVPYHTGPQNDFQHVMREGASDRVFNHQPMKHKKRLIERFRAIMPGESQSDVAHAHAPRRRRRSEEQGPGTYDQNNRRMFWDRPCHTLAASFYANFLHPELHRNFTPREGARVQTFPDRYIFEGKPTVVSTKLLTREGRHAERHLCQYNQIGNAVPPFLARQLLTHVRGEFLGSQVPMTASA